MYFDSHCHLTDDRLRDEAAQVVARAREHEVTRAVTIGSDADDSERAAALAGELDGVWATAGVHPHEADGADADAFRRVVELCERPDVVALGETGLDYYYENSPRQAQQRAFERHLREAADRGLPVVVHSREADEDTAAMIRAAEGSVTGVLHCFAGGAELFDAGLEAGWFVSFSGLVTFDGYGGEDLVRAAPAERLLIETDSPYLAPVPKRGRRNEPAFVRYVAESVAGLRGEPVEDLARSCTRNTLTFYRLEE